MYGKLPGFQGYVDWGAEFLHVLYLSFDDVIRGVAHFVFDKTVKVGTGDEAHVCVFGTRIVDCQPNGCRASGGKGPIRAILMPGKPKEAEG